MSGARSKGKFITLEGIEGAGKSTQMKFIERYLRERGRDFIATREPGGTPVGEALRQLLLRPAAGPHAAHPQTELLLMFAARVEHLRRKIIPALQDGLWVLCDRFTDSTYAYQGGGRGVATATIEALETLAHGLAQAPASAQATAQAPASASAAAATEGAIRPDLTIYLDLSAEQGLARTHRRGLADRFEQEDLAFFRRVRDAYRQRAELSPQTHHIVDAAQNITQVSAQIRPALERLR